MRKWEKKDSPTAAQPSRHLAGLARQRLIGDLLVDDGLITEAQLEAGLAAQRKFGGRIVENLIALGYVDAESFTRFLGKQPGVGSIDLSNYEIARELVDLVPKEFAIRNEVFPIDRLGKLLTIGMVCPLDAGTMAELERMTGLRVKSLLCAPEDIRKAIDRYYVTKERVYQEAHRIGRAPLKRAPAQPKAPQVTPPQPPPAPALVQGLDSSIRLSSVASLIRQVDTLPALPETVQKVRAAVTSLRCSVSEVADIIALDPPVVGKILGVANSAAYGFRHRIDNITFAVSLLGLREIYSIVLSVSIVDLFQVSKHFDYRRFWLESMCCAGATRVVAKAAGRRDLTGVFAAGLLHNIGALALDQIAPELYAKVDPKLTGEELLEAEERILGISHPEAGYELACHWDLPPEIAQPIRFHHRPGLATESPESVAIVALASAVAESVNRTPEEAKEALAPFADCVARLGIDPENIEAMLEEFRTSHQEAFQQWPLQ